MRPVFNTLGRFVEKPRRGGMLNSSNGQPAPSLLYDFLVSPNPIIGGGTTTTTIDTSGTFVNSAGLITQKTTNVWPLDYDPVTLQPLGRPIWEARTNLLLNSLIDGSNIATQAVVLTAAQHALSIYGTGSETLTGASTAGPLSGAGAYPTRSSLLFTPSAGSVTLTRAGTAQFANLELGAFPTPFIPTAGTAVTRAADVCSIAFNPGSQGTLVIEWMTGPAGQTIDQYITRINDGTGNEDLIIYRQAGTNLIRFYCVASGAVQFDISSGVTVADMTVARAAVAFSAAGGAISVNGSTPVTSGAITPPVVTNLLHGGGGGPGALNGWLRKLAYYPQRFINDRLPNLYP